MHQYRIVIDWLETRFVENYLDYCVQFWALHFEKDRKLQERSAESHRDVWGHGALSYEDKLRDLDLFSLEKTEGNLIDAYKHLMSGSK